MSSLEQLLISFMRRPLFSFLLFLSMGMVTAQPSPRLHYFYNSGWIAETSKHILVFDFIPHPASGISFNTLRQRLKTSKQILVFITHDHQDHFDSSIFDLAKENSKITWLLGWEYSRRTAGSNFIIIKPGDSVIQKNYTVYTHVSTDAGSGMLVKIDGLSIYHAGDHALWGNMLIKQFTDELKYIRSKTRKINLAFLPAARGMFSRCAYDSILEQGIRLSADILKPASIALQHIGCPDKLIQYKQVPARLMGIKTRWIVPEKYNQKF